jgi:hypothetical protein
VRIVGFLGFEVGSYEILLAELIVIFRGLSLVKIRGSKKWFVVLTYYFLRVSLNMPL